MFLFQYYVDDPVYIRPVENRQIKNVADNVLSPVFEALRYGQNHTCGR
jgi:hypothetical protein